MNKIIVSLLFFLISRVFSQISGIIFDSNTLKPLSNVNVSSKVDGTISKADGTFTLMAPEGSELTFTHIGYEDGKLLAKNDMTIYLKKNVVNLDEIIVKSGIVSKSYLNSTNSLTVIRLDDIIESGNTSWLAGFLRSEG